MTTASSSAQEHRIGLHPVAQYSLVAATVFAASYAGIMLLTRGGGIAPIWVANAFLIFFILGQPRSQTWNILAIGCASRFCAGLVAGSTPLNALVYTLCNVVEILIVALPLRKLDAQNDFARPKSLLWFYALAAGPAPVTAALPAAIFAHFVHGADFLQTFVNWYVADGLGLIVLVPLLFTVRADAFLRMFRRDQFLETMVYIGAVGAIIVLNIVLKGYPLVFLFFPAVLFLTFQRSFEGGAIGLAMVSGYLIAPLFFGQPAGGLHLQSAWEDLLIVEIFIAVVSFSVVLVGAALNERRRLEDGLSAATERAEIAKEEAIVAREAAEKANRMKSMFLATMSHELRTPLNAVIGFSQLMEGETFGPLGDPHYHEYSGLIQKAGLHLLDLINDILDMSKIEAGKFELHRQTFDIRTAIEECVVLMRERARQGGIQLVEDVTSTRLEVEADPRAIKQILLNLLSNAVKFTPAGGKVTARAVETGGVLFLSVSDTGVGIPADQLYRLGNPFVQLRNNAGSTHEGTGLGLALVRSLAEMHGGQLRIESVENKGTTVTVEIPAQSQASLAA